jgi:hypothetical protein
MMDPERRSQVEAALQRPLTDEELVVVDDLAALPPSHFAVIEQLHRREPFAALHYLRAVISDDDPSAQRKYVLGFDSLLAERHKPKGLRAQQLYESELGRALTDDETVRTTSIASITPAQREVARALAVKDHSIAMTYLSDLVLGISWQERQLFLDSLPRAE